MELELPTWLPPVVASTATEIQDRAVAMHKRGLLQRSKFKIATETLRRLVSDSRMKTVWRELYKTKRVSYRPSKDLLHQAILRPSLEEHRRWGLTPLGSQTEIHERAVASLFETAHKLALNPINLPTVAELDREQETLLGAAKKMREAAEMLGDAVFWYEEDQPENITKELEQFAEKFEMKAKERRFNMSGGIAVKRRKPTGDQNLRGYVNLLASDTRTSFGSPLYSTVATITNVALNRNDLSAKKVREMLPDSAVKTG